MARLISSLPHRWFCAFVVTLPFILPCGPFGSRNFLIQALVDFHWFWQPRAHGLFLNFCAVIFSVVSPGGLWHTASLQSPCSFRLLTSGASMEWDSLWCFSTYPYLRHQESLKVKGNSIKKEFVWHFKAVLSVFFCHFSAFMEC